MYALAGLVIEKVTGKRWETAVTERIFSPLGMSDSTFAGLPASDNTSASYFHIAAHNGYIPCKEHRLNCIAPAIAINSTITDMLKWIRLHLSNGTLFGETFISNNQLKETHTHQIAAQDCSLPPILIKSYGLGWRLGSYRTLRIISHGGTRDGFQSHLILIPNKKIGIIILTNSATIINNRISREKYFSASVANTIIDKILGISEEDWTQKIYKIYENAKHTSVQQKKTPKRNFKRIERPNEYSGTYEHPAYGKITIEVEKDHFIATYGEISSPILPEREDTFIGTTSVFSQKRFTFKRNEKKQIAWIEISLAPRLNDITFKRKG